MLWAEYIKFSTKFEQSLLLSNAFSLIVISQRKIYRKIYGNIL